MMSGIPVPPCNTIGTLVTSFISFILSKLILGSFIYKPCKLPTAGAKASIFVSLTNLRAFFTSV